MNTPQAIHVLDAFRQELYRRVLLKRRDALFELGEAMLTVSDVSSLVRLSLSPLFQRQWASLPDALDAGRLDENALRRLIGAQVPLPSLPLSFPDERPVWVCDGSVWPRPKAETSPERTYGHWTSKGIPQTGVIPCWEYQWLGIVPSPLGSWYLPLDVLRRRPGEGTPTQLALAQVQHALEVVPEGYPRPIITFDSNYDVTELALPIQVGPNLSREARLAIDALARLSPRRRFYRRAGAYSGKGRRPIHGRPFRLPAIADRPLEALAPEDLPDRAIAYRDPLHGVVTIAEWQDLHPFGAVGGKGLSCLSLSVIRVQIERLPKSEKRPKPLWLCWISPEPLPDLMLAWAWYRRRFICEHGFRFFKQTLGWTRVRPRWPKTADRWTWLLVLIVWELWLARLVVADQRLPWEREVPLSQLSPGRIRRAIGPILAALSHPQVPPQRRGKPPGRAIGCCPGRRTRYNVVKSPKKAAKSAA